MSANQFWVDVWAMTQDPKVWVALGWLFATLVGTMPPPLESSSRGYCWMYNFLQKVAANNPQQGIRKNAVVTTVSIPPENR